MKYIKKKINLENFTVRSIPKSILKVNSEGKTVIDTDSPKYYYGTIPEYKIDDEGNFILTPFGQKIKNTIDVNIFITQKIDDMGIFTDNPYVPSTNVLTTEPVGFNSFVYGRLAGAPINFYYAPNIQISGYTDDSLLLQVKSYRKNTSGDDVFVPGLNTSDDTKNIFNGVTSEDTDKIMYTIGANTNSIASTGIKYITYKNKFTKTVDEFGKNNTYKTTIFQSINGGWTPYNTSLSATTKKEEYLGVVFKPEVDSVVFINRGVEGIFERHSLLSEIKTTNDIDTNRGGFIRI
jgi:hypothetical protein